MKKKILIGLCAILGLAAVIGLSIWAGGGKFFQGALYNIRPIYTACKIEGKNFSSNKLDDCEHFYEKFQKNQFPDGEYTVFTKYTDRQLAENIIPLKIDKGKLSCNFIENGYQPNVIIKDTQDTLSSQVLKANDTIPVGSNGLIVQLNYLKDQQKYFYDTNICEGAFSAKISDDSSSSIGTAKLDWNGFINSRPLVNEILLTEKVVVQNTTGQTMRKFKPGNVYAQLNAAPDLTFKFTIPCSESFPEVQIPNLETNKDVSIPFQGLTPAFLKVCGDRLYLSLQNSNRYDDVQNIQNLKLHPESQLASYHLKLNDLARLQQNDTTYPITFLVKLVLRDRSDSNEVFQLGQGALTITSYTKPVVEITNYPTQSSPTSETASAPETTPTLESTSEITEVKGKALELVEEAAPADGPAKPLRIRRMPEKIVNLPEIKPADVTVVEPME